MYSKSSKSTLNGLLALARPLRLKFKGDSRHLLETTSLVVVTNYFVAWEGIYETFALQLKASSLGRHKYETTSTKVLEKLRQ